MLLRRYGNTVQGVIPDFDPNALTEISFRRDRSFSMAGTEFDEIYEKVGEESLSGETEGPVQTEAERELLLHLEDRLKGMREGVGQDEVLLVESQQGVDYPKLRDRKEGIVVDGENRLYFHWRVEPPLRIGIYRRRGA